MNFKFFILVVIYFSGVMVETITPPACSSIPLVTLDYKKLTTFNPFTCYQTTDLKTFKCTKVVLVGPAVRFSNYTGSAVIIRGNYTTVIDYVFENSVFNDLFCSNGARIPFRLIYSNWKSSNEAGYCVAACDKNDGIAFESFACVGRGIEAYNNFQKFINDSLPGVPGIVNANSNCEQPKECAFFTN